MVGTIVHQLTRNLTEQQIKEAGYDAYFIDHTAGVYPAAASGTPWSADGIAVTGDTIADLTEDLAAEQKARVTYDNILRFSDDPDVTDAIRYLRAREIVHFQRFGETLRSIGVNRRTTCYQHRFPVPLVPETFAFKDSAITHKVLNTLIR